MQHRSPGWKIPGLLAWLLGVGLATLTGCSPTGAERGRVTLLLGAYTTPREAYSKAILPAFQQYWRARTGQEVEFQESYQASGAQARAIMAGFEADIAALSLEGDLDRIAQAGLITHDWRETTASASQPYRGVVSTSIVVLAVRPGNPQGIRDWVDLTRPGLQVLTPDPKTSGGAQWNILALYGAALRGFTDVAPQDEAAATRFLTRVLSHVTIMDKGARESMLTFEKGVGDVALTYENEVLVARRAGRQMDYVVPRSTVLIENPVALVDKYVDKHGVRPVAEAFVQFLWSQTAQQAYAQYGLRPVEPVTARAVQAQFPPVADLWRVAALGGWSQVTRQVFGPDGAYNQAFAALHEQP